MKILITISYDGTNYAGWQRQNNAIAVQEKLEDALSTLLKRKIEVQGASRTDAGVHAIGQCVCFVCPDLRIPLGKLPTVLTSFLPSDISVTSAKIVDNDFNPRFGAQYKTYEYKFYNGLHPNPLLARYSTFVPHQLNVENMQNAAALFIGKHDFAAFCATGSSAKTTVREIYNCNVIKQSDKCVVLTVTGNAFLYNMVRIIAGTLLYVGIGKISSEEIPHIIASKDRKLAGKTMPPQGLTLLEVVYK